MQNIFKINIDLKKSVPLKTPILTEGDSVVFEVSVFDDGKVFDLSNASRCVLLTVKPDGNVTAKDGKVTGVNKVTFNLGYLETSIVGKIKSVIQVYDLKGRVSSFPFNFVVKNDPSNDYVSQSPDTPLLQTLINDTTNLINILKQKYDYTQQQGDYAKAHGDYAKAQGDYAQTQGNFANEKGLYAQQQGDYAKAQGDYAKEHGNAVNLAINNANAAANKANEAANNANTQATNAQNAAQAANTAASNANTKAAYAQQQGDYAKSQAELINYILEKGSVAAVNGKTGNVVLTAEDVNAIPTSEKGVAGGVARLNEFGKVVDANGVEVEGKVKTVNGVAPDENGNIKIETTTSWNDLSGKPSTFPPSAHAHQISEIDGLQDALNEKASNVDLTSFNLNIIDIAVELETLKGATLNGVTANIFIETFTNLNDINLMNGGYDSVNKRLVV